MSTNELQVPDEFLKENSEYVKIKKPAKKGGPYSKNDKDKRMNEVYRLHFEYGYSARKIAEMMNVNRNTINGDIDYWFSRISKNVNLVNPEDRILIGIERMHVQLTRLREQIDKVKNNSERMSIERLIYDINSKIIHTYQKVAYSELRTYKVIIEMHNDFLMKNNYSQRSVSFYDTISVSQKAQQRINRIIAEDRQHVN